MEFLMGKRHFLINRVSRRAIFCLLVMVLMTVEPSFLAAASAKTISEEQLPSLHAALVLKIAMFVEWPDDAPVCEDGKFPLAIAGDDAVFDAFEKLSDKKIKECELLLIKSNSSETIQSGRILFISSHFLAEDGSQVTTDRHSYGILTISDEPNFCAQGGMITITIKNGRPHFTINVEAASASGIRFSSKLLKIATIYKEGTS